jgi:hypothetical protein
VLEPEAPAVTAAPVVSAAAAITITTATFFTLDPALLKMATPLLP